VSLFFYFYHVPLFPVTEKNTFLLRNISCISNLTGSVSYFSYFKTKSNMAGNFNYAQKKTDCTKYPFSGCYLVIQLKTFVILAASLNPAYDIGSVMCRIIHA